MTGPPVTYAPPTEILGLPTPVSFNPGTAQIPFQDTVTLRTGKIQASAIQGAVTIVSLAVSSVLAAANAEVRANASTGAITVGLPASASFVGQPVAVIKIDSSGNTVTVVASGSDTISGAATVALSAQWGAIWMIARTGGWDILAQVPVSGGGSVSWTSITGKPTTIAGYGITNAPTLAGPFVWSGVTSTPSTLAGYGIGDAYTKTASDARYAGIAEDTIPAGWNLPWAQITGAPASAALTQGTWIPIDDSGSLLDVTVNFATYTQIGTGSGSVVIVNASVTYPHVSSSGPTAAIGGLPFIPANDFQGGCNPGGSTTNPTYLTPTAGGGGTDVFFYDAVQQGDASNEDFSDAEINFTITYVVA